MTTSETMTKIAKTHRRRKDARPGEIIEAALFEFNEKGFGRSTLAGIAKHAGISRTTIYLYFTTKEAILEAAIRGSVEQTIDGVHEIASNADGDFRTLFSAVLDLIYAQLVEGGASTILKILVAEGQTMPELVAVYRREILSKGEKAMEALIERGIASGELSLSCRNDDVRLYLAPSVFASLWQRVFHQVDPLDLTEFKNAHMDLVVSGLLARE